MSKTLSREGFAVAEFVFGSAQTFSHILECMNNIIDDVEMTIEHDGIRVRQMDPSRVAMLDYVIEKEAFEEWMVHTSGKACFNVSEALKQVPFKRVSKDTKVKAFIDGKDGRVTFTLIDTRIRKRTIDLLEPGAEEHPVPKVAFKVQNKLLVATFIDDLEDLKEKYDHVVFLANTDQLTVTGVSENGATFRNEYRRGGDILIDHHIEEDSKTTYSLSYLTEFAFSKKILKLCDVATLNWATAMPLKVELHPTLPATLVHWLAPRVDVE